VSVRFTVYGKPAPQGSKIRTRYGMREASDNLEPWREAIVSQIIRDGYDKTFLDVPVVVSVTFTFERLKSHYGTKKGERYLKPTAPFYKHTAPDTDKLQRALGDALVNGGVLRDDDLIVVWHARKVWGERGSATVEVAPAYPTTATSD
jgi:Holliday junction resolvase RusA-like endonuclease